MAQPKWSPSVRSSAPDERPWSPLALALIALFLPEGAIVTSVRNLERLGVIHHDAARFYSWATAVLLASLIVLIWSLNPTAFERAPAQAVAPITIAAPIVSFSLQFPAFIRWRRAHPDLQSRSWMSAVLPSLIMTVVVVLLALLGIGVLSLFFSS
jgi:hypothetical protein